MSTIRDHLTAKQQNVPPPLTGNGATIDDFPGGPELPLSKMAESYLSSLRTVARSADQRILIAGCRVSNLGDGRVRDNPKLELWESDEEARWVKRSIPKDVGVVIPLRWVSHPATRALSIQCKQRGILFTGILSTGDVRQLIDLAFKGVLVPKPDVQSDPSTWKLGPPRLVAKAPIAITPPTVPPSPPPAEAPTPTPIVLRSHTDGLSAFIRRAGFDREKRPIEEAERLLPAVRQADPTIDVRRLSGLLGRLRREDGGKPLPKGRRPSSHVPRHQPVVAPPPVAVKVPNAPILSTAPAPAPAAKRHLP